MKTKVTKKRKKKRVLPGTEANATDPDMVFNTKGLKRSGKIARVMDPSKVKNVLFSKEGLPPGTASVDMVSFDEGAPVDFDKVEKTASVDPWAHRSEGMRCASCMWSVMKRPISSVGAALGRCRRRAPTLNGYPAIWDNDWCGDHKLDENKL